MATNKSNMIMYLVDFYDTHITYYYILLIHYQDFLYYLLFYAKFLYFIVVFFNVLEGTPPIKRLL